MKLINTRKTLPAFCLLLCLITTVFLFTAACTDEKTQPSQGTPASQPPVQTTPPPSTTIPPTPTPPAQTTTPPAQTPPVTPPPSKNPVDTSATVTVQASQLSLTLDDLGPGWTKGSAASAPVRQAISYSHVYFSQGSAFPPVIQNTVAVYRTIENASDAYEKEKTATASTSNPNIGNECFLNDSVPRDKKLVFRKSNIVVWIWMQQYVSGDIESYARIVEKRIANSLVPSIPVPASTPSSPLPSQPAPAQPPAANPVDTTALIKKQAYQMVLTLSDMGPGWSKGNASPPAKQQASSTCHMYFSKGTAFAPGVQNTTAVYRTVEMANVAFEKEKPTSASLSYPNIGDACFLSDTLPLDKKLVFRKNNVVVWIWVQQYAEGDIEGYAKTVEQKISP